MTQQELKKTRLGELLLEKKLISKEQLEDAISSQKSSYKQLGDILVQQKLVSKWQIRRTLKVQHHLRNAVLTSVLSFAPLMLVGCGGGGGSDTSKNISDVPAQEQPVDVDSAAQLSWTYPSKRADGSDLDLPEIATFRIYHTTDDDNFEESFEVNGDETALIVEDLSEGEHYFAITVVDTNGLESDFSEPVSKTIL
jgi:hypothetical protein